MTILIQKNNSKTVRLKLYYAKTSFTGSIWCLFENKMLTALFFTSLSNMILFQVITLLPHRKKIELRNGHPAYSPNVDRPYKRG